LIDDGAHGVAEPGGGVLEAGLEPGRAFSAQGGIGSGWIDRLFSAHTLNVSGFSRALSRACCICENYSENMQNG